MPRRLAITAPKVFALLQVHGPQTPQALAMRLGWGIDGVPAVEACLAELEERGLIANAKEPTPSWLALALEHDQDLADTRWQNDD